MSEPKMTAEERVKQVTVRLAHQYGDIEHVVWPGDAIEIAEAHAKAAVEEAQKRWMLERARCECAPDDACRYARERDEAIAEVRLLRNSMGKAYTDKLQARVSELEAEVESLTKKLLEVSPRVAELELLLSDLHFWIDNWDLPFQDKYEWIQVYRRLLDALGLKELQ